VISDPAFAGSEYIAVQRAVTVEGPYGSIVHFNRETHGDAALWRFEEVDESCLESDDMTGGLVESISCDL
jgi:hypothetical protein